ncbi:MAG: hypothetical protein QOD10_3591 [Mycobacterium sp.]|jgi:hypothetical protein|nr:hypothetical protein [Mycobacterium sp.]
MRTMVLAAAAVTAMMAAAAGTAGADPTPTAITGRPDPGTGRPEVPRRAGLSPFCAHSMIACGFRYDPGTGTWQQKGDN